MRVAHVVSTFPPKVGGMGSVCYNEANALAERGHDVTVFTLQYPGSRAITGYPFKTVWLKSFPRLGDAGNAPQLIKMLKDFDVVHLHYPFYGGAEWVLLAKLLNKQKYVVTYHMDARPTTLLKFAVQKIYDLFFPKAILSFAEKVIAVDSAHFIHSKFGKKVEATKVVEIHNAVDSEIFYPHEVDRSKFNISPEKKIILFVGNALKVKRLDVAIEAMIKLENAVLLVVGGGYEIESFNKMVEDMNLKDKVFFVGYCRDTKILSDYYNIADCVVIPSDTESFSLVAIEALACGTPIVGSDIPAIRARIDHGLNGFLAKPGSAEDFSEKIKMILSMPAEQRKAMGESSRKKIVSDFGWKAHVDKLEKVYASI